MKNLKLVFSHKGFMRYFKNTSWLFAEKILRMFEVLFVGIWVARYLGPESFGLLSYAQAFVFLFASIATLGLDTVVVRELVKDHSKTGSLIGTAFFMKLAGALLAILLILISLNFTSNDNLTNLIVSIIASTSILKAFDVVDFYFQSKVMSRYVVYAKIIALSVSAVLKILLILFQAPLLAFAWVILIDAFILTVGYLYFFFKNIQSLKLKDLILKKEIMTSLMKDSWPLMLSGIIISIYMKIDQVMIKEILGIEAVGQYAAAAKLSEAWYFIPMVLASSLFPAIINAKKHSNELYFSRLQKLYDSMVWLAIAIAIPVTFMSDWLINLLYGAQYSQAGGVLTIHIWTGIFVFLGVAFSSFLTTENWTKKAFYRTLLGAIFNIALNFLLIPSYGIKGAAIATLIGQFTANYIYDIFDKDLHNQLKMKTKSFFPIHYLLKDKPDTL